MSTYGSRLRGRLDLAGQKQFGQVGMAFPESFFEEKFQQDLAGGPVGQRVAKRAGKCPVCFQYRAANLSCGCDY